MKSILLKSALTIALMSSANLVRAELVTTSQIKKISGIDQQYMALLHKDLKCKAPLIEPNLRRNLGKWST